MEAVKSTAFFLAGTGEGGLPSFDVCTVVVGLPVLTPAVLWASRCTEAPSPVPTNSVLNSNEREKRNGMSQQDE